jgi:peptide/nickel transport system permease protein
MQPVFLLTDIFVFAILLFVIWYIWHVRSDRNLRANWRLAMKRPVAMVSSLVLGFFLVVALADSIHFREALPSEPGQAVQYSSEATSVLDKVLAPLANARERSYSEPLAALGFKKETFERDGQPVRDYPRLRYGGQHLDDPVNDLSADVTQKSLSALALGLAIIVATLLVGLAWASQSSGKSFSAAWRLFVSGQTEWPWRSMAITFSLLVLSITWVVMLSQGYHVFGTDRTGNSVLVFALKSVRTALVIGGLTTLVVAGGVGANEQLRESLGQACAKEGFSVHYPPMHLCTDNGAMIAFAGAMRLKKNPQLANKHWGFDVKPRWPLDDLEQ